MSELNMVHPAYQRLRNVKANCKRHHYLESPGIGWNGEGRSRTKVFVGDQGWFATTWRGLDYADGVKDVRIDHKGWYTDEDGSGGTMRGVVVQLPSRNGEEVWLAGYKESESEQYVFELDETYDEASSAAYAADSIAERAAEREREFQAKSNAKYQRVEMEGEIAEHVEHATALIKVRNSLFDLGARNAVRHGIRSHFADIRQLRDKVAKSIDEWGALEDVEV